jgi:hypothetical protein
MNSNMKDESYGALENYLKLLNKKFGSESKEYSDALTQVGSVYLFFQEPEKALKTLDRALFIKRKVYGESHQTVG